MFWTVSQLKCWWLTRAVGAGTIYGFIFLSGGSKWHIILQWYLRDGNYCCGWGSRGIWHSVASQSQMEKITRLPIFNRFRLMGSFKYKSFLKYKRVGLIYCLPGLLAGICRVFPQISICPWKLREGWEEQTLGRVGQTTRSTDRWHTVAAKIILFTHCTLL